LSNFQLTRVERPRLDSVNHDVLDPQVGGQWEWCWANALPYGALATPSVGAPMPAAPQSGVDFMPYLGYWASLQSFLTYSFGWTRHDRGLRWWFDAGRPIEDARFELIEKVWGRDGNLPAYVEWCHDRLSTFDHQALAEWTDYDSNSDLLSEHWQRRFAEIRDATTIDGTTPHGKHLEAGSHVEGPASTLYEATIAVVPGERRALYSAESAFGWYRGLVELGAKLPPSPNGSWRVDVFVRPIGFMGTYRRSWETGLWFSGLHRYHAVGN